jgi:HSP20 family protein
MANLPVRRRGGERRPTAPVAPISNDDESTRFAPDCLIEESEDGFVFRVDLAGIKENEVDIAVTGNRLTISGHIYNPGECSFAGFKRAFTLPEESDGDRPFRAVLEGGLLTVAWSRAREPGPETTNLPGDDPLERWESDGGFSR